MLVLAKKNHIIAILPHYFDKGITFHIVGIFSDILVAFLYFDISGKYQNMEKPLKHQRRLGLPFTEMGCALIRVYMFVLVP